MRNFTKPIPSNNNVAGSGAPRDDIVKTVEALTEIRSVVPNTAVDIGAASGDLWSNLLTQITTLEKSVNSFL